MAHPRAYSGVAVTAGELPLAPTLHIVKQRNTQGLHQQKIPRVASRSCRGDREVARHIRMAHPRTFRGRCHRGRASTRPYIACCTSIKYGADYINKKCTGVTSRSCRGDWEVARHIRMAHPRTFRGWCHRGRASTRPYIACCTSTKYTGITSTKYTGVTPRSCRGDWEVARHIRMAHPRTFRGWCHRGRASTRPYIACCTSTKYAKKYINKNTPRVTSRSCRGDWEVARPCAWRTRAHPGVAVTAGELPLAPTLHAVNQRNTQGLHQQKCTTGYIAYCTSTECGADDARHGRCGIAMQCATFLQNCVTWRRNG